MVGRVEVVSIYGSRGVRRGVRSWQGFFLDASYRNIVTKKGLVTMKGKKLLSRYQKSFPAVKKRTSLGKTERGKLILL